MSVREIPLTRGKVALVDEADYESLSAYRWHAINPAKGLWYAQRRHLQAPVLMHRQILAPAADLVVDHIDGDGLNNQRSNLRAVTASVNCRNNRSARARRFTGVGVDEAFPLIQEGRVGEVLEMEIGASFARCLLSVGVEGMTGPLGVNRSTAYRWMKTPKDLPTRVIQSLAKIDPDPDFLSRIAGHFLAAVAMNAVRRAERGATVFVFDRTRPQAGGTR